MDEKLESIAGKTIDSVIYLADSGSEDAYNTIIICFTDGSAIQLTPNAGKSEAYIEVRIE